jgi:chemotaxis signal transduction protein
MRVSNQNQGFSENIEELRRSFDQRFAAPHSAPSSQCEDFLAVRIGKRPYAFRAVELARIEPLGRIAALPGGNPWLVGLANSKGKLIPVYSLELALGFDQLSDENNWIAICREESLGLAFNTVDGYLRIPLVDIVGAGGSDQKKTTDRLALNHDGELRHIAHLPSILVAIRERISAHAPVEEVSG